MLPYSVGGPTLGNLGYKRGGGMNGGGLSLFDCTLVAEEAVWLSASWSPYPALSRTHQRSTPWSISTASASKCPLPAPPGPWTTASPPATSRRNPSPSTPQVRRQGPNPLGEPSPPSADAPLTASPVLRPCLPVPGVAHRFHSSCGKNVAFQDDGCRAVRVAGFCHGIVFSMKELKTDEIFEVRPCQQGSPEAPKQESVLLGVPRGERELCQTVPS